jgi:hypothetical protein
MTAHPRAHPSAEQFLFVLFYEQQTPVFVLSPARNVSCPCWPRPLGLAIKRLWLAHDV